MADGVTKRVDDTLGNLPMLISAPKAAERLGISARHLWNLTKAGDVPCNRVGRRVMYSPALLQAWVNSSAIIGGNDDGKHS